MPLNNQEYQTALRSVRDGSTSKLSAQLYSKASAKQRRALDAVVRPTRVAKPVAPKVNTLAIAKRPSGASKSVRATAPVDSSRVTPQLLKRHVHHPLYNKLYEASFGSRNFPVPKPHHPIGSAERVVYPRSSSNWRSVTVGAGNMVIILPTPYHHRVAARCDSVIAGNPNWTYSQYEMVAGGFTCTLAATAVHRSAWPATTAPTIFTGLADSFGWASVADSLLDSATERQLTLPYAQVLGGSLSVMVRTPYDGLATVSTLGHNECPTFSGDGAKNVVYRRSSNDIPGFDGVIKLPTLPLSSLPFDEIIRTFGTLHPVAGNHTRTFTLGIPQDKGWFRPGSFAAASFTGTSTAPFNYGFCCPDNPMQLSQYGAIMVENPSSVPITVSFQAEYSWALTFPDFADEQHASTANPLLMAAFQKAKTIMAHNLSKLKSGAGKMITNAGSRNNRTSDVSLSSDDHHGSSEVGVALGAAGLEAQTSFLSKTIGKIKGFFSSAAGEVEAAASRGPIIEEVIDGAEAIGEGALIAL